MKKYLALSLHLLITSFLFAQTLPDYLPADGLVAWYPFNGNANDESGNGNHGTVNGAALASDRNGNADGAYSFDGINDYIEVSNNLGLGFLLNGSYSINHWVYLNNTSGVQNFVGQGDGDGAFQNRFWRSYLNQDNVKIHIRGNESDPFDTYCTNPFQNPGNWIMITMVRIYNSNLNLFINGELVQSQQDITGPASPYSQTRNLLFGAFFNAYDNYNDNFLNGSLDDIAIYNRALSQEEITALYTVTPINGGGGNTSANAVPPGIPYQAVIRNANGQVAANTAVTTRFTLHQNTTDGAVEYQETHGLTTNEFGLINTVFGSGSPVIGTFDNINWSNTNKFIQIDADLGGGYIEMGTQQLMSVPYSIQSQTATTINNTGLPIYANNAAALAGGLTSGQLYRTATGDLKIVY